MEQLANHLNPYLEQMGKPKLVHELLQSATAPIPASASFFGTLVSGPFENLTLRRHLHSCRRLFADRLAFNDFKNTVRRLSKMRRQQFFFRKVKGFLSWWRAIHVVLAVFLVVVIALHIYTSTRLGYRWIF